jgi:murein hydrolase activator
MPDPQGLERRLAALEREEQGLERALAANSAEIERLEQRVVGRGRVYYRTFRGGPRDDWFEHAIRVERLRRGLLRDLGRLRTLNDQRADQRARLLAVRERRAPLVAETRQLDRMRQALLAQREREEAFERAFSKSHASGHTAIYGAGMNVGAIDAGEFAQMRGRLPFPLPGRAEVQQVRRPWAQGAGLAMAAPAGTSVRAVFGGRVAFADEYADYGKTVILDHGDSYYTVTAHLGSIEVAVGDEVPAGSRLGSLGTHGGGRGELYFEIRRAGETLTPAEWLGI